MAGRGKSNTVPQTALHDFDFISGVNEGTSRTLVFPDQVGAGSDFRFKDETYVVNSAGEELIKEGAGGCVKEKE